MKTHGDIVQFIIREVEEVTLGAKPAASIRPENKMIDDIGLDSLDYATVLLSCEQWLGIKVSENDVDWRAIDTVEKLAAFLAGQQR